MSDAMLIGSILDSLDSFTCILDQKGSILAANEGFSRLVSGHGRERITGLPASDAVQGSSEMKEFLSTILKKKDGKYIQSVHRNRENPIWVQFSKSTVNSPDKGPCVYLSGQDVTALFNKNADLERTLEERTNFLIRMGHELKTPINTVLGYAQLLSGLDNLPVTAQDYAGTIVAQENNLLHLLNDILEYTKYESGQTVAVYSETNVKKLIEDVIRSYIDEFSRKMLSITFECKKNPPCTILSDPGKISQVLSNLLGNAIKYTKKGGVTVTVTCDSLITIDVEDTGIGIPDDEKDTLFDVMIQDESNPEHTVNTGIGLAVARIFARMLGGDLVLVHSGSGSGTLIRFTFEAKPVESTKKQTQQIVDYSTIKGISRPCKILLVDDVDINLAMLEIFLAPAGFDLSVASNGKEALRVFNEFKPDIVFMDLIMPDMDGFEATRRIKEIDNKTPVIALTASIVDSVKSQALEVGVNDFMYKPFIPERFFEIIAEYTGIVYTMG